MLLVASISCFIPSLTSHRAYVHDQHSSSIDGVNICKCKNLTKVYVSRSSMEVLPSRFLVNCHSLEYLILSDNKIMEISHDTFYNLSNLFKLDLSVNQLTTLPRDVFKPLINLEVLLLSQNRIEVINSDLFFHNQHLFKLNISYNNLKTIEPESFRTLKYLLFLDAYNNPNLNSVDFFYEARYVDRINVANCGFTQLFIPMNVTMINAQGNEISYITAHQDSKISILMLNHNNFTNISRLPTLVDLHYLHIAYNGIDHINFSDLSHLKKLKELFIELNPKQNISIVEIKKSLPSLRKLTIISPYLSMEKQKRILNDFKDHKFDIHINGEEYSASLEDLNRKQKELREKYLSSALGC